MQKNEMDKSGKIIIKFCIFSIIISLTALLLCGVFHYFDKKDTKVWNENLFPTIIIDPGHGGEDGGASSADGTKEKELNLYVSLILADMLKASGYKVVLTRDSDTMLYTDKNNGSLKMQDLKKRIDIANSQDNAIFISIHMNKFSQSKYFGTQVFYSTNHKESANVADMIQTNIKKLLQTENERQTKAAGSNIYILDNINIPAVLVECGFLSNPTECDKLKNDGYRKELASVIYGSIIEFLEKT